MSNKRGQLTVFIIIGIVLVILITCLFFLVSKYTEQQGEQQFVVKVSDKSSVKYFAESCVEKVSAPGIYLLAKNGGFVYDPDYFPSTGMLITEKYILNYHDENNIDPVSEKKQIQDELNKFIADSFKGCLSDFELFREYFDFEYGEIDVKTRVNEDNVEVNINYPITIIEGSKKTELSEFSKVLPIRLGYVLDVKNTILEKTKNNDKINLGELSSHGVDVSLMSYDESTLVYSIYDLDSNVNDKVFVFNFAVENSFVENKIPIVNDISDQTAYVSELFYLDVGGHDPENQRLTYEDETVLFDIGMNGKIMFTPVSGDVGNYEIPITISDGVNEVEKKLRLSIEER